MSTANKKIKLDTLPDITITLVPTEPPRKRYKPDNIAEKVNKNFEIACKHVSYKNYVNYQKRFLLIYVPTCIRKSCNHHVQGINITPSTSYTLGTLTTELWNQAWYEALEVANMSITSSQYLSTDFLKYIVEIMMNVHDDKYSGYSGEYIVEKCQQVLLQNFNTHPPCGDQKLRECYLKFLTTPMIFIGKETLSNRSQFKCEMGIVKYCLTRLEYELGQYSRDEPYINKGDLSDTTKTEGINMFENGEVWRYYQYEIFEGFDRTHRIERLLAVLESVIELLQFDLAIWHSRNIYKSKHRLMRSNKLLMSYFLNDQEQILRIFTYVVHLQYSDSLIKIMTKWLNTVVQTVFVLEANSNMNYPSILRCSNMIMFVRKFYDIILEMPIDSFTKILERIEPTFLRYQIGLLHLERNLCTFLPLEEQCQTNCIISILIVFFKALETDPNSFPFNGNDLKLSSKLFTQSKVVNDKINYLLQKGLDMALSTQETNKYAKTNGKIEINNIEVCMNHVIQCLFLTFEAFVDAYDLPSIQRKFYSLNQEQGENIREDNGTYYSISTGFKNNYETALNSLNELKSLLISTNGRTRKQCQNRNVAEVKNIFNQLVSTFDMS